MHRGEAEKAATQKIKKSFSFQPGCQLGFIGEVGVPPI